MKRAFVAINLPEEIKEKLVQWQEVHKNFDVRWTKKDSLHITLYFISWIKKEKIKNIISDLKAIAENSESFDIYLTEITAGPDEKRPRMIWANGPTTDELIKLQKDVAEKIEKIVNRTETLPFKNHITLARKHGRIKLFKEELDLKFSVKSFELMESKLLKDGAEYRVIESFKL